MRVVVLVLTLLPLCFLPSTSVARTWHVRSEAPTIQAGIDSAGVGDTVLVAAGTYTGDGNRDIDFGGKDIVLRSEDGPEVTVIDCGGSEAEPHRGFIFQNDESWAAVVEGVTVTHGYAQLFGGGVLCDRASPSFLGCVFVNNAVHGLGGGMQCLSSSAKITDCTFSANQADDAGGLGLLGYAPVISNCRFLHNEALVGAGAVYCYYTQPTFTQCVFSGNSASVRNGGGLCADYETELVLSECVIEGNSAPTGGGGLYTNHATLNLDRCLIAGNWSWGGGGLYATHSVLTAVNCAFVGNSAAEGSGVSCEYMTPVMERTIIAFGVDGEAVYCLNALPELHCCDVFGNAGGDWKGCIADQYGINGNISEDPLFCDPENGDFHLDCQSPCAPAQQPDCGLIGALGVGCGPTATVPTTWGLVKSIFQVPGGR